MGTFSLSPSFVGLETERRLVSAASVGDVSTVRKLLRKKVNPDVRDEFGYTAISKASAGEISASPNILQFVVVTVFQET